MDKRKVITAYRRGFLTMEECAQILGIDSLRVMGLVSDTRMELPGRVLSKEPINR